MEPWGSLPSNTAVRRSRVLSGLPSTRIGAVSNPEREVLSNVEPSDRVMRSVS